MSSFLTALALAFLALAMIGAISKRWLPRLGVVIGIGGLSGMFTAFLALLATDAFNGLVQNYCRGTGTVLLSESPGTFWALMVFYSLAGCFGRGASIWAIRKHLKGQLWPSR